MDKNAKINEYKQIQATILKHLFDKAESVSETSIQELIKKPVSETQYHLEVLANKGLIVHKSEVRGGVSYSVYRINQNGRKTIMES